MPKICTRCLLKDFSKEQYEKIIVEGIRALPAEDIVSEELEAERLDLCGQCEKLNRGTCLACGCFVEIRAATKKGRCPYGKW
ncbi:MAG: DUF6171 family protein [Saccharofermentans sp.]|nr:DUF6171 family protein [Saccharofermentans sp.]